MVKVLEYKEGASWSITLKVIEKQQIKHAQCLF